MPTLEDLLRDGVERRTPPDDAELFQRLVDRRRGRSQRRRIQAGLLAIIVLASSVGGFALLTYLFRPQPQRTPQPQALVPTNGPIVFSRVVDASIHLFAVKPRSGEERQLTPQGEASYVAASVSPDGTQVLVVHRIPGFDGLESVLATVPVEGGPPTWLTDPGIYHDPAWSPDGTKIAYGGRDGLFIMNADGSAPLLILEQGIIEVRYPTWSPDGVRLAFAAATPLDSARDIYSVALDGSGLINLTSTRGTDETQPAWSWSTDRLAFVREGAVVTAASDGSDIQQIVAVEEAAMSPSWSPDGQLIAFESVLALADFDAGGPKIWIVEADGSKMARITPDGGFAPAWAPALVGEPPSPAAGVGRDIGLDFRICSVDSLGGIDFGEATGRAWSGRMVTAAGRCPAEGHLLVAADVDGDGSADTWTPFQCRYCGPYLVDTTDLNGDGVDEVIVSEVVFSAPNYRVFTLSPNPQRGVIMETTVGGSGHPGAGLAAGSPMILSAGGDAGISDFIRCEGYPANTVIVQTRTFSPEGRSTTELHITRMRLGSDGIFEILDTFDSTPPAGDPIPGDPGSPRPPACGVDWDPNSV